MLKSSKTKKKKLSAVPNKKMEKTRKVRQARLEPRTCVYIAGRSTAGAKYPEIRKISPGG